MEDYLEKERADATNHLVILVHGINTRASWMGKIKPALERAGFLVAPTTYGKYGTPRFLSPFRNSKKAIECVAEDIRTARQAHKLARGSEPTHMSVISHSFGTYVVGKILTDYPEFSWHRVVFCGSLVAKDFCLQQALKRFDQPLLIESGTRDYWPALAASAGWGYSSVGSTDDNRLAVVTRWHKDFRHSDFLTEAFCKKFWTPFLQGNKPKRPDRTAEMPTSIRAITWLPLRWLPVILLLATLSFALWHFGIKALRLARTDSAIESLCTNYSAFCANAAQTPEECFRGLGRCNPSVEEQPITIVCMKGKLCSIKN